MKVLWQKYSKEEITKFLQESTNMTELIRKLGYRTVNNETRKQIYKMLEHHGFSLQELKNTLVGKMNKIKMCGICKKEFIIKDTSQASRKYCFECSPSTNNPTIKIRAMREKIIEMKGGKCIRCGYDKCMEALELHHEDPSLKDYQLSNTGGAPSFEKFLEEADKCILLCANCHREEHCRLRQEKLAG